MKHKRQFASDNYAGICPEAWNALQEANAGHAPGYGDDEWTHRASDALRDTFETDCDVYFVFNGTAANSLALASLCQSYHSILCHEYAHVERDECGAPEFFSNGTKVLLLPGKLGRIEPDSITETVRRRTDIHYPKPRVVTITQPTELGTVYSLDQLRAIQAKAEEHQLHIHMDGARFANAVAALGVKPSEITWKVGVDVLCFGGTKNGMAVGETVIFFNHDLAQEFEYRCKQAGQLASKMRFLSAPWLGMLKDQAWIHRAQHANEMASLLHQQLSEIDGINILFPCEANSVFIELPIAIRDGMYDRGWKFYCFIGEGGARLMCSWDTTPEDVKAFTEDLADLYRKHS